MDNFVVVIKANGAVNVEACEDVNRIIDYPHFCKLKDLCDYPIGLWQVVLTRGRYCMLIAEDGKLRNYPVNRVATSLYINPCDPIVGDVVICTFDEFSLADLRYLTRFECECILRLVN